MDKNQENEASQPEPILVKLNETIQCLCELKQEQVQQREEALELLWRIEHTMKCYNIRKLQSKPDNSL